ncbi:Integral membrane protein [Colletotrichum higginsianum IMI 349063]|uniref:Integral membrane protein n=1 Tax=Colletotrichum higginsianum (strain IMI 349063) TaxID=759273 RepID=A0A1B7YRK3_COLHI|nr:Integral membrane protein [Colletotrichum higginsianum IMI 349063]OBR14518.1 Integral membrane protein [Colletotrichum higginsianum IMI 349063]
MLATRVLGFFLWSHLGLVSAALQLGLEGIPNCAVNCMLEALPETNCSPVDQACLCADKKFSATVEPCVRSLCTIEETLVATNGTWSRCGFAYTDDMTKIRWVSGVVTVCASIFMVMRLTTKVAKLSTWGADDTVAVVAFVGRASCSVAQCVLSWANRGGKKVVIVGLYVESFYFAEAGLGKDIWTLLPDEITHFLKLLFVLEFFYLVGLAVIKASILFFFLRIFPERRFRRVLWLMQVLNMLVCLSFVILCFAQCRPFSHFWTGWDGKHEGKCLDLNKIGLSHVALNIVLDVCMLALPVTQIYKLQMDRRKKIGVIAMFQVGVFLTVVSILRIRTMRDFATSLNVTADSVAVVLWAYVELGVGVVVACMPNAWQLLKMIPSKVTQLTTTVTSNIGSSVSRTRPNSQVFPEKPRKVSMAETISNRSETVVPSASSSRRASKNSEPVG